MSRILVGLCSFVLIAVFAPTATRADPIVVTSGTVTVTGILGSEQGSLAGDNFLVTGLGGDTGSFAPQHCFPCAGGSTLPITGFFGGSVLGAGTANINGTLFTNVGWGGQMFFNGGSVIVPSVLHNVTITVPFTFTADLHGCSGICVTNPTLFTVQLVGSGIATLQLDSFGLNGFGQPIFGFSSATFQFEAVPEPASILLLGGGLAVLTAKLRRRRSSQNDSEN